LASGSPRRQELLAAMGVPYRVLVPNVDEAALPGEGPAALAVRLSAAKAQAVADTLRVTGLRRSVVIAADTLVALDGEILGKPADGAEAQAMLGRLRGRVHRVYSGLALLDLAGGRSGYHLAVTPVSMRAYGDDEIVAYVASGDPLDKAGAYAIQYREFAPVDHVEDCYANVMGLPMCHLYRQLRAWGLAVAHPQGICPYVRAAGSCPWAQRITSGCSGA
jgi:septum formation protein